MKRYLLSVMLCVCASIGAWASISVWPTNTNGVDGYGVYNWDDPGDVAAFLNGTYTGTVYNRNDEDADWVTDLLPLVKAAETVKLGGNADQPKEPINTDDLKALEKLTRVKYLRLDNCFPAVGTDFSQIKIGSSALLDATMPIGLTKDQIEQANTALKATASGLKTTSGITGTVTTTTIYQYWYELNGQTLEYTGTDAAEGAMITLTDYDVEVPLTAAAGYPIIKYTNSKNNDKSESVTANDVISDGKVTPEYVPVALTEIATTLYTYNGTTYDPANEWWLDPDGTVNSPHGGPGLPAGTKLEGSTTYSYSYQFWRPDWYKEDTYTLEGEPLTDPDDGHKYALIPNSQSNNHYQFDITTSEYKYTYTDLNGATQNYPAEGVLSSPDDDMKYTLQYSGEVGPLTMTTEVTKELTVDGSTIYVNEAGTLSDVDYMFTGAQNTNLKSSKNITVLGNVNDTDLGYLGATNFASAKLIDVSETTKASGATYGTLTSAATDAALFLPKAVTKDELITLEAPNYNSRTCAYVEKEDEDGNRVMHVYANSGSVANLAPVVDNKTAIYFLKYYGENGDTWAGANYTSGNEAFRLGLGALHAISMDFTNYQACMLPDFTHLTSDTHFLTVAQNDASGKDNVNFTLDTDASNYKYTDDVWVVSTYKANDNVGKTYGNSQTLTTIGETALITYIREEGKMEQAAPFLSDDQKNASRVIFVTKDGVSMTESDIECISYMNCNKLDFLDATVSDANLLALDNDNVKYIALPDNSAAITATSPDDFSFSKCASLLSVASYNTTTGTYRVHSTKNLDSNGKQIESVYVLTQIIRPKPSDRTTGNEAAGLTKVDFSGYFNFADIATDNTTNHGLYSALVETAEFTHAVFPDNNDMNFYAAGWEKLTSINLPKSNQMTLIPENCLNGNKSLTEICIPYNYQIIRSGAFHGTAVEHITTTDASGALIDNGEHTWTLSANITELGSVPSEPGVFVNQVFQHDLLVTDIYILATKAPKCYAGVFPANASYGYGGASGSDTYCRDKYYNDPKRLSKAWIVLRFPSEESYNAAKAAGQATDATYAEMKANYTDPTRVYTKKEQTGAVDANGDAIVWPTRQEANRSYNQGSRGLTWLAWDPTSGTSSTGEDGAIAGGETNSGADVGSKATSDGMPTTTSGYTFNADYMGWHQIALAQATYYEPAEKKEGDKIVREYEEAGWYTFCIPYNMSYKQVVEMLGVPKSTENVINKLNGEEVTADIMPDIRQLSSVTRKAAENGKPNIVMLRMTKNLWGNPTAGYTSYLEITHNENSETHKLVTAEPYNASSTIDDRLSLIGGRPYIIMAYKRKQVVNGVDQFKIKGQNLGKYVLERYADQFGLESSIVQNTTYESYLCYEQLGSGTLQSLRFAKPYEDHRVQAVRDGENGAYLTYETDENNQTVTKKYYYTMVGQFWQQPLPQYCLYMSKGKWYRYTNVPENIKDRYTWDPYKCIIMATEEVTGTKGAGYRDDSKSNYPEPKAGTTDLLESDFYLGFLDGRDDDDFEATGTHSKYMFTLDDDIVEIDDDGNEYTAIEQIDGETIMPVNAKVYNMSGQYVGTSLQGLSKGLYIVNGKKYIVK
ncbi:MAG: leucine-rich repeat domain-containing protein [Prevotella sp.]|nr:leucine-rich repeat domain-containing protein [Prevotella sp.]